MTRQSPGSPSRWQIWYLDQQSSRANSNPIQPTDAKKLRPYLILVETPRYSKVICLPVQDLGSGASHQEVALPAAKYPQLTKDSKVLCYEVYTVYAAHFTRMVCVLRDEDRKDVLESVKRFMRLN